MNVWSAVLIASLGLAAGLEVRAQAPDGGPEALAEEAGAAPVDEAAVEAILAPYARQMAAWPARLQAELRNRARLWAALTPAQQQGAHQALAHWETLGPEEKMLLRERFAAWEQLDRPARNMALDVANRFDSLPASVQQAWRERFAALSPEQRRIYLFDPDTREAMALAMELFPFIPSDEYEPTLSMLRALDASDVGALRNRLRSMSAGQRQALRQRLLGLEPAARAAALRGQ